MLFLLGQVVQPPAEILDGGTRGLIYALVIAVMALSGALVWLSRRYFEAQSGYAKALAAKDRANAEERYTTLQAFTAERERMQSDNAAHVQAVQKEAIALIEGMVDRMTANMESMGAAAGALRDVVTAVGTTTRLLETTLERISPRKRSLR